MLRELHKAAAHRRRAMLPRRAKQEATHRWDNTGDPRSLENGREEKGGWTGKGTGNKHNSNPIAVNGEIYSSCADPN